MKKHQFETRNKITKLTGLFFFAFLLFSNSYCQNTIMNSGFENGIDTLADDWTLSESGAGRTSDFSASGDYSLSVWNWYWYISGFSANGTIENPSDIYSAVTKGGTPFVYTPTAIEGFYRYDTTSTVTENDSAVVEVFLKKYNNINQSIDTVAHGIVHLPATDLTQGLIPFQIPIMNLLPGVSPDSIVITLQSSINGNCEQNGSANCLYLYVDDLSAMLSAGIQVPIFNPKVQFWPNPVIDMLSITIPEQNKATVSITDLAGKVVLERQIMATDQLNLEALKSGAYILNTTINGVINSFKIIKK